MGASTQQYDHQPGFDLSSLTSANQSQVMQALAQMGPLSNIGGIIVMSGGGGTDWPGVVNNPRFKRYLWIDTYNTPGSPPTVKIYDQSGVDGYANWISALLADGSVTTAKLAALSVRSDKMSVATPGGGTWTARWICRINGTASAVEYCDPNAIFSASELPLTAIDITGAPAGTSFLKRDASAGITSWAAPTFSNISGTLPINRIAAGTNGQVIGTLGGVAVADEVADFVTDGTFPIAKLQGGAAYQALRRSAANVAEWAQPPFSQQFIYEDPALLSVSLPSGAATVKAYAHGLGAHPRLVYATMKCVVNDIGYTAAAGEEVNLNNVFDARISGANDAIGSPVFTISADAVSIIITTPNITGGDAAIYRRDTGVLAAIVRASWRVKLYAFV